MGTWGAGNFDNDQSLDYVGDLMDRLTTTVIDCFTAGADLSDGESSLMPSVAIMRMLSENCGAAPPKPNVIEDWRSKYLAIYDQEIDDYGPDPHYKTFAELTELATKFWKH